VTANGLTGRLYTSNEASAAGQPAYVLLHGIGVSHRYLARLHVELARGPKEQNEQAEGVESCIVVGHSMGVQFAVELALQAPGLVTRTVLMGPVVDPERRSAAWHALALTRDALFSEPPSTNAVVFTDYFRTGLRWYLTELPVMMEYPLDSRIRGVAQPVLVLRGGRDPIARRPWCQLLAGQAPDGAFAEVPGCGHVVQDTAPEEVARAIRRWVGTAAEGSAAAGGSSA
jgi:pimeloyl-ACP methyl ester carboxylesterase